MLPCDAGGVLECPTYWRNDDGTREFQPCNTTEALHGDQVVYCLSESFTR